MTPRDSWNVIELLGKLELDNKLTPRAQTVAKLLHHDLKKIREEMEQRGGFWKTLRKYEQDEQALNAQVELYQRMLNRTIVQMEILHQELKSSRNKEIKTVLLTDITGRWNVIMRELARQFPSVKTGQHQLKLCEKEGLCCFEWVKK